MTNEKIISGGKWTLVWENADVTANFPAQTIQLDLSSKKEIFVKVNYSASGGNNGECVFSLCMVNGTQRATLFSNITSTSYAIVFNDRYITADSNGVTFEDCRRKYVTATSSANVNNAYLIPRAIYAR